MKTTQDWFGLSPRLLRKLGESGDPNALLILATLIEAGLIEAKADAELFDCLRTAASASAIASYAFARVLLARQKKKEVPTTEIFDLLHKASEGGISKASTILGLIYDAGVGCEKDEATAKRYYELGAAQGDPEANGLFASRYIDDKGAIHEPEAALPHLLKAVEGEYWPSASHLAKIYFTSGKPDNIREALRVLHEGADNEDFGCLSRLTTIYRYGKYGVKRDQELAKSFEQRAMAAAEMQKAFLR